MNVVTNPEISVEFKPERISRSAQFTIHTKVEDGFPLFGPIREMEWAEGWSPEILYPTNEKILVEEHMVFQTNGQPGEGKYTWVITQYQPDRYLIEYTVSTQDRIWFIRVICKPDNNNTHVQVSYTYTSLTEEGNQRNKEALNRMFAHGLKDWEEAINYYLKTGKQLTTH